MLAGTRPPNVTSGAAAAPWPPQPASEQRGDGDGEQAARHAHHRYGSTVHAGPGAGWPAGSGARGTAAGCARGATSAVCIPASATTAGDDREAEPERVVRQQHAQRAAEHPRELQHRLRAAERRRPGLARAGRAGSPRPGRPWPARWPSAPTRPTSAAVAMPGQQRGHRADGDGGADAGHAPPRRTGRTAAVSPIGVADERPDAGRGADDADEQQLPARVGLGLRLAPRTRRTA